MLSFFLFLVSLVSCNRNTVNSVSFIALGTSCKITLPIKESALQKYVSFVYKEENTLSYRIENSEIARINKMAGEKSVKVSTETYELIKKAIDISKETDEAFNPLLLPVIKLWGFDSGEYRVPLDSEIKEALSLTDIEDIVLNDEEESVFLKKKGMGLDLGGIAKGEVSDRLYKEFQKDGVPYGSLNLGGNVFVFGEKERTVAIQKPYEKRGVYEITESVKNKAVITSGAYERYFEKSGKTYHHIIDPATGYPSSVIFKSVTIIGESGTISDAWATAIFIKGEVLLQKFETLYPSYKVIIQ